MINFTKDLTNIINDYDKLRIICNNKIKYNNNECNIDITNYDKKILVKKIENICRTNNLNINKLIDIINKNISNETNNYFTPYFKINDDLEQYNDLNDLLNKIKIDLSNINDAYEHRTDGIIGIYFTDTNINNIVNDTQFESRLNDLTLKIFNNFYKKENGNGTILSSAKDNLIKFRNNINILLKISDKKIEKKIYEEKDNVLNLNKKISEVNYIFINLIIIYIIIIFLIKYIK